VTAPWLGGRLSGQLLRPADAGFEDAATGRIFNARRPSRRPAAVLRPGDVADVAAGVRLAAAEGLGVAVRAGGHSWAAWSLREDTLLIDLAAFTDMDYDERTGIVTAGPAVRGGLDLDPFLAARGRFFASGHCPTVGLGGFLLQGGMGWNCRGWGWAAESVDAVQVVTADGDVAWCDETSNADLFWAARGSGPGFFGVVTAFRLRTRERYRELTQTTYVYPPSVAGEVLHWLHSARHDVPPSVELVAVGSTPPPDRQALPREPGQAGPALVVDGVSFDGGPSSLRALGTCPVAGTALARKVAEPVTIGELRAEQVRANPEGHRYVVDNAYLAGPADSLIPAVAPAFAGLPTAKSFSLWFDLAHLPARPLPDMALSVQGDIYFATYVVGESPAQDASCRAWVSDTMSRLAPFSAGCYLGDSDFTVRTDRFMSDAALDRFKRIRADRDPGGLFCGYDCADPALLNTRDPAARSAP
jgi:FAD/FMN-containing dehydrogenase